LLVAAVTVVAALVWAFAVLAGQRAAAVSLGAPARPDPTNTFANLPHAGPIPHLPVLSLAQADARGLHVQYWRLLAIDRATGRIEIWWIQAGCASGPDGVVLISSSTSVQVDVLGKPAPAHALCGTLLVGNFIIDIPRLGNRQITTRF
jgi:hypothetical protein